MEIIIDVSTLEIQPGLTVRRELSPDRNKRHAKILCVAVPYPSFDYEISVSDSPIPHPSTLMNPNLCVGIAERSFDEFPRAASFRLIRTQPFELLQQTIYDVTVCFFALLNAEVVLSPVSTRSVVKQVYSLGRQDQFDSDAFRAWIFLILLAPVIVQFDLLGDLLDDLIERCLQQAPSSGTSNILC
jgi:hypothetical protein